MKNNKVTFTEARNFLNSFSELSEEELISRLNNAAKFESHISYTPHSSAWRFNDGSLIRVFHSITSLESLVYFGTPNSTQAFSWLEIPF